VFVKHFELEQADGSKRRLETRFLVHSEDARFYGVTYRWRPDNSDADLQNPRAFLEPLGDQVWHYPSRSECGLCHNSSAGYVLGLKTEQLNRQLYYPSSGLTANVLTTLQGLGLFSTPLMPASLPQMPTLHQGTAFAEERARAYLDANCAHCHRPDGPGRGEFDLRFTTPLGQQNIVGGDVIEPLDIMGAALLTPQEPESSVIFKRLAALGGAAMPPLAKGIADDAAVSILSAWLAAMNRQPGTTTPTATDNLGLSLPANSELAFSLAASDADGDALDYRISRMPAHGTLEGIGNELVYRPHPDFVGIDGFTFVVRDGANVSEAGSVQLTVAAP
jgi:cytochrome c553